MQPKHKKMFKFIGRMALSGAILAYLLSKINYEAARESIASIRFEYLLLALLPSVIELVLKSVKWQMLMRIKDYAKRAMDAGDALPRDAAKALYAAIIAHARTCGYATVSSLPPASFERLGRWCLAQSWAPPAIRTAVREAVKVS